MAKRGRNPRLWTHFFQHIGGGAGDGCTFKRANGKSCDAWTHAQAALIQAGRLAGIGVMEMPRSANALNLLFRLRTHVTPHPDESDVILVEIFRRRPAWQRFKRVTVLLDYFPSHDVVFHIEHEAIESALPTRNFS